MTLFTIGMVRPEEAIVFDEFKGEHKWPDAENGRTGSFEVFWSNGGIVEDGQCEGMEIEKPGWYWGVEGEVNGPFARSRYAHEDAMEESAEDHAHD